MKDEILRCEDCFEKLTKKTKCTIKAYGGSDYEKILCVQCANELLVTQSKHFYCVEHEN